MICDHPSAHVIRAALLLSACAAATLAQVTPPSASAVPRYVLAESLAVIARLESATRATPNDASAWHRLGKLAWSVRNHLKTTGSKDGRRILTLSSLADNALHQAMALNPTSAEFHLDVGRLLLESGVSLTRAASYGHFEQALELVRRGTDRQLHARAAIEVGRVHWRRFDGFTNRWMTVGDGCTNLIDRLSNGGDRAVELRPAQDVRAIRDLMTSCAQPISNSSEQSGEADYLQAETLFREAFRAAPSSPRAFGEVAMLLSERGRWVELASLAREHLASAPRAGVAWLALGLVEQRQGRSLSARTMFDTALALLSAQERSRVDRLERILRPADSLRVAKLDSTGSEWFKTVYWKSALPLWSNEDVIPRTEFLARVAEAEFRWSVHELNVRGADTDRGEVFIRYGRPGLAFLIRPPLSSEVYTVWGYDFGLVFKFAGQVTFATAQIPPDAQQWLGNVVSIMPVRWSGLENLRVDSLPIQVARFRGAADSLEVLVAIAPPASSMRRSSELHGDVRADVWFSLNAEAVVARDSVMNVDDRVQAIVKTVPFGTYLVRGEASLSGASVASRATAVLIGSGPDRTISAPPAKGFAMSDVLVAIPGTDGERPVLRWRDLDVKPFVGTVQKGAQVALIWENYGLAQSGGAVRYSVDISLRRQRSGAGRVAAAIVGGVGRAVGVTSSRDQISLKYDREAAASDGVVVENIVLALQDTPPGTYTLTVTLKDAVTWAIASRIAQVTIGGK